MKVNTKIFVNSVIIIAFFISIGVALYIALADDSPSKGVGTPNRAAVAEAELQWQDAGEIARQTSCSIWNDAGGDREFFYLQMTTGENRVSADLANAKIDILEEDC